MSNNIESVTMTSMPDSAVAGKYTLYEHGVHVNDARVLLQLQSTL